MSSKIPPALSSIVRLPSEASLILLTGVQNATSNWLVLRYIYAILNSHGPTPSSDPATSDSPPSVVLCSYLRDMAFWHAEAKRLVSLPTSASSTSLKPSRASTLPDSANKAALNSSTV